MADGPESLMTPEGTRRLALLADYEANRMDDPNLKNTWRQKAIRLRLHADALEKGESN